MQPTSPSPYQTNVNAPDPEGGDRVGVQSTVDLTAGALGHPELLYEAKNGKDVLLQADVYADHVHLHCPICRLNGHEHGLMIRAGDKDFEYVPLAQLVFRGWEAARMMLKYPQGSGGTFNVAAFTCPWCSFRMRIVDNVVLLA